MRQKLDIAPVLAAIGAVLLFISLFMHWYQPALSAWTVFEVWDLVLAALAVAAIWVAMANLFREAPLGDRVLPILGGGAFVIVVSQIVNHPPAAQGAKPEVGAWLALFGSALMAAAGVLSAANVSVTLSSGPRESDRPASSPRPRRRQPSPANEAAEVEPEVHDELYPAGERRGPIGADDPEPWTAGPEDETLRVEPESEERS